MTAAADRLNGLLSSEGFSFVPSSKQSGSAHIIDCEGERLCNLTDEGVLALSVIPDDAAVAILRQLHSVALQANERGYKSGIRAGRAQIVDTVHELLGVKRFEEALASIEVAVREAGRVA
jgi:hypothetical protein